MRTFASLVVLVALATLLYIAFQGGYDMTTNSQIISYQCPDRRANRSCQHLEYFKDIVLIIVYNYPYYDSIPDLRRLYEPVFPKLFICGPKEGNKTVENMTHVFLNKGIYGYKCLSEAIRQYPGNEGYLYINDDVILNYWNLVNSKFDKNLIWESSNQFGKINLKRNLTQSWYWWISPYGVNNTKYAISEVQSFGKIFKMYKDMFYQYKENGNGSYFAYSGRSDVLYIPRKHSIKFQELSQIFYKHGVFLEIAVPTILQFLAPKNEISRLRGHYIPGDVRKDDPRVIDSRYFWSIYLKNEKLWFIHPFKLHHKGHKNRELNLALLEHILVRKTREFVANC